MINKREKETRDPNIHCLKASVGASQPLKLNRWKQLTSSCYLKLHKSDQTPCRKLNILPKSGASCLILEFVSCQPFWGIRSFNRFTNKRSLDVSWKSSSFQLLMKLPWWCLLCVYACVYVCVLVHHDCRLLQSAQNLVKLQQKFNNDSKKIRKWLLVPHQHLTHICIVWGF